MRSLIFPVLAVAVVAGLSGCITIQVQPPAQGESSQEGVATGPGTDIVCGDDGVLLSQPGTYGIDGDCDSVTIDGADIVVSAADIDRKSVV